MPREEDSQTFSVHGALSVNSSFPKSPRLKRKSHLNSSSSGHAQQMSLCFSQKFKISFSAPGVP